MKIVILPVLNVFAVFACKSNDTLPGLPNDWPCEWNAGNIPFAYNFYTLSPKRMIGAVTNGIAFIESRTSLTFIERDPVELGRKLNVEYLYFTYSGVLEKCCLTFLGKKSKKRMVLVTPVCSLPSEVAHVILHGLGLTHRSRKGFAEEKVRPLAQPFNKNLSDWTNRIVEEHYQVVNRTSVVTIIECVTKSVKLWLNYSQTNFDK